MSIVKMRCGHLQGVWALAAIQQARSLFWALTGIAEADSGIQDLQAQSATRAAVLSGNLADRPR